MVKSYNKLLIFIIALITILLLSNFISSVLNYLTRAILLLIALIIFKVILGTEKDRHRYTKDLLLNIIIVILISFILFYLSGLIISFTKTTTHYSMYGLKTFILPFICMIILKEYLRYQMIVKAGNKRFLIALICIMFILFDIGSVATTNFSSGYNIFIFIALTVLPAISTNIVCTYIATKSGYKPNIIWLLVVGMYGWLIPIIPNTGIYVASMIDFLFPVIIGYETYLFFKKRDNDVPLSSKTKGTIEIVLLTIFVAVLIYFSSGLFKYYTIAIATGSMTPNIMKGDVVVIDQKYKKSDLKEGNIIAYRYENKIIVHRLVKIEKNKDEIYYYTQGDANNVMDDYIIYKNMILGVVDSKIPYIGLPTIWLNEL